MSDGAPPAAGTAGRRAAGRPRMDPGPRRDTVIEALWQIVARDGLEAATARSVATEAGLTLGAVTRVFATQDDMHLAAMTRVVEQVGARLRALPLREDRLQAAEERLAQVVPLTPTTRVEATVYYSYLARARTTPALRAIADEVDGGLARLCREAVHDVGPGVREADLRARELHALTEGLAYALVTWPHRHTPDQARALLRAWLARLAREGAAPGASGPAHHHGA